MSIVPTAIAQALAVVAERTPVRAADRRKALVKPGQSTRAEDTVEIDAELTDPDRVENQRNLTGNADENAKDDRREHPTLDIQA